MGQSALTIQFPVSKAYPIFLCPLQFRLSDQRILPDYSGTFRLTALPIRHGQAAPS